MAGEQRHCVLRSTCQIVAGHTKIISIIAARQGKKRCKMRITYAIAFVSDMARSVAFYRDVVGIPLKFESPGWTEFMTEGATLALHKSDAPATDDDDHQLEAAGRWRSGFEVPNLDEFHKRMIENQVRCTQEPTETFGAKIAQYLDPDGLVFSVGEARSGQ
jgi:lactoylglutathione lyase